MTEPDYGHDAALVDSGAVDRVCDEPFLDPAEDPDIDETQWASARDDLAGHPLAAPDVRGAFGAAGEQWIGPPETETGTPAARFEDAHG